MKRIYNLIFILLLLSSCSIQNSRQASGTMVGLQLGTIVGSAVGGVSSHSYSGQLMGTAIGAITGAAVGNVINKPHEQTAQQQAGTSPSKKESKVEANRVKIEQLVEQSSNKMDVTLRNVNFKNSDGAAVLQADGYGKLSFDIYNYGDMAVTVYPMVQCSSNDIIFSEMTPVQSLVPEEGVRYTLTVYGNSTLSDGSHDITIYLSVDNSEYVPVHKLKIITENR